MLGVPFEVLISLQLMKEIIKIDKITILFKILIEKLK